MATENEQMHAEMVSVLVKHGDWILSELTGEKVDLWHAATGVSGEAGELLDAIKKHVVYNKPLDRQNIVEELGDMEFYMEQLRQRLDITRDETLTENRKKLAKRYENYQYSNAAAQARADKQETGETQSSGKED